MDERSLQDHLPSLKAFTVPKFRQRGSCTGCSNNWCRPRTGTEYSRIRRSASREREKGVPLDARTQASFFPTPPIPPLFISVAFVESMPPSLSFTLDCLRRAQKAQRSRWSRTRSDQPECDKKERARTNESGQRPRREGKREKRQHFTELAGNAITSVVRRWGRLEEAGRRVVVPT